jgi:hypothetical protein
MGKQKREPEVSAEYAQSLGLALIEAAAAIKAKERFWKDRNKIAAENPELPSEEIDDLAKNSFGLEDHEVLRAGFCI